MKTRLVAKVVATAMLVVIVVLTFRPTGLYDRWRAQKAAHWIANERPTEDKIVARLGRPSWAQRGYGVPGPLDFAPPTVKRVAYYHGMLAVAYDEQGRLLNVGWPVHLWGDARSAVSHWPDGSQAPTMPW